MCPEGDAEEAGGPARTTRGAVRVLRDHGVTLVATHFQAAQGLVSSEEP